MAPSVGGGGGGGGGVSVGAGGARAALRRPACWQFWAGASVHSVLSTVLPYSGVAVLSAASCGSFGLSLGGGLSFLAASGGCATSGSVMAAIAGVVVGCSVFLGVVVAQVVWRPWWEDPQFDLIAGKERVAKGFWSETMQIVGGVMQGGTWLAAVLGFRFVGLAVGAVAFLCGQGFVMLAFFLAANFDPAILQHLALYAPHFSNNLIALSFALANSDNASDVATALTLQASSPVGTAYWVFTSLSLLHYFSTIAIPGTLLASLHVPHPPRALLLRWIAWRLLGRILTDAPLIVLDATLLSQLFQTHSAQNTQAYAVVLIGAAFKALSTLSHALHIAVDTNTLCKQRNHVLPK